MQASRKQQHEHPPVAHGGDRRRQRQAAEPEERDEHEAQDQIGDDGADADSHGGATLSERIKDW